MSNKLVESGLRILITGGAGFIGRHLSCWLLKNTSAEIVIFDNLHRAQEQNIEHLIGDKRVVFIHGDIRDEASLSKAAAGSRWVFHLAAQSNVIGAQADLFYSFSTNVMGTFNVLRTAHQNAVERLIFTSSREVYGDAQTLPVNEKASLQAKNAYGASKIACEQYCHIFKLNYGLDVRVLRLSNVYGPGDGNRVIPIFCRAASRGEPLVVYGGKQVVDFIWIGDVVRAIWEVASVESFNGPMNIGGGQGITILELSRQIRELFNHPNLEIRNYPAREIEVSRYIADINYMKSVLGWLPTLPALSHLAEVAALYRHNRTNKNK